MQSDKAVFILLNVTIDILTETALDRHQGSPQGRKLCMFGKKSEKIQSKSDVIKFVCPSRNKTGSPIHLDNVQATLSESNWCGGKVL